MKQITDEQLKEIINLLSEGRIIQAKKKLEGLKNIKEKRQRCQKIILESGLEVIIDHNSKTTCDKCNKGIVWAFLPLELVSLAKWEVHKCKSNII